MSLENQIIIVTGALGTLGAAACAAIVAAGGRAIAVDCVEGAPTTGAIATPACDLTNASETAAAFAAIQAEHGRIDGLVNIAGGFAWEPLADGSIETWDRLYQMNVRTAVNASSAALAYFPAEGGRIVNIGAAGARKGDLGNAAYAASKSGVHRLTESLAAELKPRNIGVNAVLPSILDTAPNRLAMPDADYSEWVAPADLANVIVFLLSPQANAITGALLPVTGRL
ncbi:SDR family NAD(P)-dependent oxidoreductase [Gammaproteobacteria bacterium LSUCC0057]|uniref:SDR family NAD(P)-dependent oxidoreductase n=1 Tax=Gammaproteobacteria bacterium LSUCC0057 TaxID=2559237 RepID=A0A4Y8UHT0_9GAMM|nr:SDR family NAD(P)-dependent oxidoreductase [Gammaproteobacteria bacterium LSUCC0057]